MKINDKQAGTIHPMAIAATKQPVMNRETGLFGLQDKPC